MAAGAVVWLGCQHGQAKGQHVGNRCPKLSSVAYEELDARILLLVKAEAGDYELPSVVCTSEGDWVEWGETRLPILGRGALVDEVVDLVEKRLHEREGNEGGKAAEASAIEAGEPVLERGDGTAPGPPPKVSGSASVATKAADARGGGISAGLESERVSDSIGWAVGPAFDFAGSVGPVLLGGREAFRFTLSGRQLALMDFQAEVGYGAPFNPDVPFGVVARFGAEWMIAYPEGNSGQAAVAPLADVGLRVAHSFGLVGLWFGVDVRARTQPLALQSRGKVAASDVSGAFTLGVAFVDWSRK